MKIDFSSLDSIITGVDIKNAKMQYTGLRQQTVLFGNENATKSDARRFLMIFFGGIGVLIIVSILASKSLDPIRLVQLMSFILVIFFVILFVYLYKSYVLIQNRVLSDSIRLSRFAAANGMKFAQYSEDVSHGGMIFALGSSKNIHDQLSGVLPNKFEIGNYQCTARSGDDKQMYRYGYITIKLDRHLPHMVLDSMSNNANILGLSISNLPVQFDNSQILSLEGDFDSHFTLYAPKEYRKDALYVFTPDLMALLIDVSGSYDAEVVDDNLYVYSSMAFNLSDQKVLARIFNIIDTVGSKIVSQTNFYADASIGNRNIDVVSFNGRRLKRGVLLTTAISIIVTIGVLLYYVYFFVLIQESMNIVR